MARQQGQWASVNGGEAVDALMAAGMGRSTAVQASVVLMRAGLLLTDSYYVPSQDELLGVYHDLADSSPHFKWRWVMCHEALMAIDRRHNNQLTMRMPGIVLEPSTEVDFPMPVMIVDVMGGKLFGKPIRIDPAARRPMIELDDGTVFWPRGGTPWI